MLLKRWSAQYPLYAMVDINLKTFDVWIEWLRLLRLFRMSLKIMFDIFFIHEKWNIIPSKSHNSSLSRVGKLFGLSLLLCPLDLCIKDATLAQRTTSSLSAPPPLSFSCWSYAMQGGKRGLLPCQNSSLSAHWKFHKVTKIPFPRGL